MRQPVQWLLVISLLLTSLFWLSPIKAAATPDVIKTPVRQVEVIKPQTHVAIPSMNEFQDVAVKKNQPVSIPWIAQYMVGLFKYGLALGSMVAMAMMMIGGVMMLSAGVNQAYFQTGKSYLFSSLLGIILLLSAYLILNSINPQLVDFGVITIEPADTKVIEIPNPDAK